MKRSLGVFSFMLLLSIFLVGCGSGAVNNPSPGEENKDDENVEKLKEDELDGQDEEETAGEPVKEEFELKEVGETFNLKDWEVTLESFKFDQSVSDKMMSSSADEGSKFLILDFKVTNNGTEVDSFIKMMGGTSIKAIYNDKYEYKISVTLIDGDLGHQKVQPLASANGFVVINMPDKVVEASESINLFLESEKGEEKVQVKIR